MCVCGVKQRVCEDIWKIVAPSHTSILETEILLVGAFLSAVLQTMQAAMMENITEMPFKLWKYAFQ